MSVISCAQVVMRLARVVSSMRSNPRYLCKYLVWTNILVLLYFVINVNSHNDSINILDQSGAIVVTNKEQGKLVVRNEKKSKFENFELSKWNETQHFQLKDSEEQFFMEVGDSLCYIAGTDLKLTSTSGKCQCLKKYFGPHCGIPESAWHSYYRTHSKELNKLRPRKLPRRLIHGLQVNHEMDLFEARLEMLDNAVDVYLLLESNYTAYGSGKDLLFLEKLSSGWLSDYHHKIQYIFLSFFPKEAETSGWYADSFLRLFLGQQGMKMLEDVRDDDIFLLLDADELPSPESLLFLKMFDGWTEPVKFGFRWNVFGFFWLEAEEPAGLLSGLLGGLIGLKKRKTERLLSLYVACTVGMLRDVYGNNAMSLRRNQWSHQLLRERLANYTRGHSKPQEWTLGDAPHYAGWHCSWCYPPAGIKLKLQSAQRDDKPRWGDFPDKLDLQYIARLIRTGEWFDGKHPFIQVERRTSSDSVYAPPYFLDNEDRFEYLMVPPQDRL